MAKVFLDTNIFIDLVEERRDISLAQLQAHHLSISPLSVHILAYLYKYHMPEEKLGNIEDHMLLVPLNEEVFRLALLGPTADFEDNAQLHSAALSACEFFLTNDRKLLKLKNFGEVQLVRELPGKE